MITPINSLGLIVRSLTKSFIEVINLKNIELYVPELNDYWYEEKIQKDPLSMNYNAGYDVSYYG